MIPTTFSPTNNKTSRKSKRRRNLTVSFVPDSDVQIQYTLHRRDYTAAETRRTWLTAEDLKTTKDNCRMVLWLFAQKNSKAEEYYCLRGLETKAGEGLARKNITRMTAQNAVFREQKQRRRTNTGGRIVDNADTVAAKYHNIAKASQAEACTIALGDEAEARLQSSMSPVPKRSRSQPLLQPPSQSPAANESQSELESSQATHKKSGSPSLSIKTHDREIRRIFNFKFLSFGPRRRIPFSPRRRVLPV